MFRRTIQIFILEARQTVAVSTGAPRRSHQLIECQLQLKSGVASSGRGSRIEGDKGSVDPRLASCAPVHAATSAKATRHKLMLSSDPWLSAEAELQQPCQIVEILLDRYQSPSCADDCHSVNSISAGDWQILKDEPSRGAKYKGDRASERIAPFVFPTDTTNDKTKSAPRSDASLASMSVITNCYHPI
jgi:hypothetical protein